MTGWQEHGDGVAVHGQLAGDGQVSEAYGRRWSRQLPDGMWASIQVSFYVFDENAWKDDEHGSGDRFIELQIEYLVCADPDEPGGTEVGSGYECQRFPDGVFDLDDDGCRAAAEETPAPNDEEWNTYAPDWAPKLIGAAV